jgi:hypothetical protein
VIIETAQQAAFVRGVAAGLATMVMVAGKGEHKAALFALASCKALELDYADFVAADTEDADLVRLRPILDPVSFFAAAR